MTGKRANGEGSITQRKDGTWQAAVSTPQGRKYLYAKTKRECQLKLRDAIRRFEQDLPVAPPRQTLAQFLERWLEEVVKTGTRPNVYIRYRINVRRYLIPALGHKQLREIAPEDLQKLYADLLSAGLAPRTVHQVHAVLHNALGVATKWGIAFRNVCDAVSPPRVPRHEVRPLSPEQSKALLAAAQGDPLEALYVVALTTGMRQSELRGLQWSDVDLNAGKLQVLRNVQRVDGVGFVEGEPKSKQSRRTISLTPMAIDALRRHRTRQLEQRLSAGAHWQDQALVFSNSVGKPIEKSNLLRRSFWPLLERAGLPHMRFHDLRHSAASLLLCLGAHPKVVQELLGHSQISITMDLYSHTMPTLQEEAVAKLGALLRQK